MTDDITQFTGQYRKLVEGNDWGDKFWGCVRGIGQNHLGKILIRSEQVP